MAIASGYCLLSGEPAARTLSSHGSGRFARLFFWLVPALILSSAGGCASDPNKPFTTSDRMDAGLVIILPGIEGESSLNHDVRRGLLNGGLLYAISIYRWGRPVPIAGPLLNQIDILGNRLEGLEIAKRIVSYQKNYPGRPVYLIGHSGGGGIAVFATEGLPKDITIDGLVLLSASISSAYDLTNALHHCRKGILNIYTREDVGLLIIATTLAGNVDGIRGPAAGAIGFDRPTAKILTGAHPGLPEALPARAHRAARKQFQRTPCQHHTQQLHHPLRPAVVDGGVLAAAEPAGCGRGG